MMDFNEMTKEEIFLFCKKRNFKIPDTDIHDIIDKKYDFDISWKAKLYLYVNDNDSPNKCYCGKFTKFISTTKGFREFCSPKCARNSKKVKDKINDTVKRKYGVDNVMMSDTIKENYKNAILSKYGVDNISKVNSFLNHF